MLFALLIGLLMLAFLAYYLHLFFQLNRSERRLHDALTDVEASMLQQYGRPKPTKSVESSADSLNTKA